MDILNHFTILHIHIVNSGYIKGITIMLMEVIESPQGWEQDGSQQPVIILARSV